MMINNEQNSLYMHVPGDDERILRVLLSPLINKGLTELAAGLAIIPPGSHSDWTGHIEGELFFTFEGCGKIRVDDEIEAIAPSTTVWVAPYQKHQVINDGLETLKILWVICPPGRENNIVEHAENR
jgi:mannose-6-phosphate isomerase-like protein (cupin superfamily)